MTDAIATLAPGLHHGLPMHEYLALGALGSGSLTHLARSPLHYQWMKEHPDHADTEATERGTAVHMAVLEPARFRECYAAEPDGALLAPDSERPRATKAYREAVAGLRASGLTVLKDDMMAGVERMAAAVLAHPHAAKLLARCPERETTMLWERDGRLCRGRADMLGPGVVGDLKTTRSLKDFSPWVISRMAYYRQAAHYADGLKRLGREVEHFFFIAVENAAPYDVGVFALDPEAIKFGATECDRLLFTLAECERTGQWNGMFPDVQHAMLSDVLTASMMEGDDDGSA